LKPRSIFAAATTVSALIFTNSPALAKMSSADEQHYREMTSAASTLNKASDWAKAREKYKEALELATKSDDPDKQVKMLLRMAGTFVEQSDYGSAEAVLRQALTVAESRTEADPQISSCLYELASVLVKEKKESEARPIFARCLEMSEKIFSANNPILAVRKGEYAVLLNKLGEKGESEKLSRESQLVINDFMADISAKIKQAWHQPPESFSYRISVSFEVLNHGKVRDIEVTKSSGSEIADKAAIDAVKNGAPFSDIDSKDEDEKFSMAFSFDYNYHHGKGGPGSPPSARSGSQSQANAFRQSRQVKEETEARLKKEKEKCDELKGKIETILGKGGVEEKDRTTLANLYSELAESQAVQGSYPEGVETLTAALSRDCFKKNDQARLSLMVSLAHIHLYADDAKKAEPVLKEAVNAPDFQRVPLKLRQEAFEDYGNCLVKNHKFAEAQDYYSKAREMKE